MKVWYVHPYAGGPTLGRYWRPYHLAHAWMERGHEVLVITSSFHHLMDGDLPNRGERRIDSVRFKFVATSRYSGNGLGRTVSMALFSASLFVWGAMNAIKEKPDVIIYSSAHPLGFLSAWFISKLCRASLIFEVRDLWPLSLIEIAGYKDSHPAVRLLGIIERFAYSVSDKVVSLLPGAKRYMVSKGMDASKFIYVSNGYSKREIETNALSSNEYLLKQLESLKRRDAFVFFYAGAFGEPNAMHKFVDALVEFDKRRPENVYFVLVGKGEQYNEIKNRCGILGFDYVLFHPQVDKQLVQQAMGMVDVGFFVMHDLPIYRFGVSLNKIFDYMSAAIPIIGAYRAFNDPITDSGCGISVAPDSPKELANAFLSIHAWSSGDRQMAGKKGRLHLETNFEYSVLAARMLSSLDGKGRVCD